MPRAPKTPESKPDIKPYARSGSPSSSSSPTPQSASKSPTKTAWTNDEYIQLFEKVAKAGMTRSTWEGAVEGRNTNQCYKAWIQTVAPYLKKALVEKATRR